MDLVITDIHYRFDKKPKISEAPPWIRERYPDFDFDKYDDVIPFSYIHPKIQKLKEKNKLASLMLPAYDNDSLFWEINIKSRV